MKKVEELGAALGLGKVLAAGQSYRRVVKLGIPYECRTVVYALWEHQSLAPGVLVRRFLLNQAAPRLYFVISIFQRTSFIRFWRRRRRWPYRLLGAWTQSSGRCALRCTGGKRLLYHKKAPRGICRGALFILG